MSDTFSLNLLQILWENSKKKKSKRLYKKATYPKGIENKYRRFIKGVYFPLVDYTEKYIEKNSKEILNGDKREDAVPGGSFRVMVSNMNSWLALYLPMLSDEVRTNSVVYMGISNIADQVKKSSNKEFSAQVMGGIGVEFDTQSTWWENAKRSWTDLEYGYVQSNAQNYVSKVSSLVEEGVINGWSRIYLTEKILQASEGLSEKKARFLARDGVGKLHGLVAQAQFQDINLDMYIWQTSGDERVRGTPGGLWENSLPSHFLMDGLLCRWDDANVCSYDGGKTWEERPSEAVRLHPGMDYQCRCQALIYYPELINLVEN